MIAVLHTGREVPITIGHNYAGMRFYRVIIEASDYEALADKRAVAWLQDSVFTRLAPLSVYTSYLKGELT